MKKIIIGLVCFIFSLPISFAQQGESNNKSLPSWTQVENKLKQFAQLKDSEFAQFKSNKKDSWKKAYVFEDQLDFFDNAEFLYGYTNTKLEYIEIIIKNFSKKNGVVNASLAKNELQKIESILDKIIGGSLQKFDNSKVRKECLICSDNTIALWKSPSEAGSKFLEKKFISLEYVDFEDGLVEITFYNNRKEIHDFFDEGKKAPAVYNHQPEKKETQKSSTTVVDGITMINVLESPESQYVYNTLVVMRNEAAFSPNIKATIVPSFLQKNGLTGKKFWVNGHRGFAGFKIFEQSGDEVSAYVWGKNHFWVHKYTFKVIVENGKKYLQPGGKNEANYIDPWFKIENRVKVNADFLK